MSLYFGSKVDSPASTSIVDTIVGIRTYSPATNGYATKIVARLSSYSSTHGMAALYNGNTLIAQTQEITINADGGAWTDYDFPFSVPYPSVSTAIGYTIVVWAESGTVAIRAA